MISDKSGRAHNSWILGTRCKHAEQIRAEFLKLARFAGPDCGEQPTIVNDLDLLHAIF